MPRPVSNPPNPWLSAHVEWLEEPPAARLEVLEERCKGLLTPNDSPDVPFRFGVNPYRGCQHACAYCYARPGHEYLGWGAGTDFDTKIVVKTNAEEVLRRELARRTWRRDWVAFSGVTDPYQPLEASYGLTRACLIACLEHRTPVALITKAALVRRDLDVLADLARGPGARVYLSIPFADRGIARALEPHASSPNARFDALAALSSAGIPTGVSISPLIPGLGESAIPEILERARAAGATCTFMILLRLPGAVQRVFDARLRAALPDRAERVLSTLARMRGGRANDPNFGTRMSGQGPEWTAIERLHRTCARRLGYEDVGEREELPANGEAPRAQQGELFP